MESTIQYAVSAPLQPGELGALLGSVGWGPHARDKLERIIAGSTAYVTAREAGQLVGFGRLLTDGGSIAYINNMAVDTGHQRRGIG
jgi:ribosomal protein S18 acetylase RimI-like enzyme